MNNQTNGEQAQGNVPPDRRENHIFESSAVGIAVAEHRRPVPEGQRRLPEDDGYTQAELREMTLPDLVEEADRPAARDLLSQLVAGMTRQFQVENRHRCKERALDLGSDDGVADPGGSEFARKRVACRRRRNRAQARRGRTEKTTRNPSENIRSRPSNDQLHRRGRSCQAGQPGMGAHPGMDLGGNPKPRE